MKRREGTKKRERKVITKKERGKGEGKQELAVA